MPMTIPMSRVALGHHTEAMHPGTLKATLAEFISTLIFVFAGQGSGMAFSKLTDDGTSPPAGMGPSPPAGMGPSPPAGMTPAGLILSALAHAFALFVAVSVSANISGGHVNPAVTLGAFLGGNITFIRTILYVVAQVLGSTAACLLLRFTTGGLATGVFTLSGVSVWSALVLEIVMTFGLVYTVYATAIDPNKGSLGTIAPVAIGFIVGANILAGGPFDGASMNPAVAFGPALVSWNWDGHWVYWAGPAIGGALAGVVYELFFMSHSHEQLPAAEYGAF